MTPQTPTTFIYSTTDDQTVPISASVNFYNALIAAGVPAEMHIFRHGDHGSGLERVSRRWTYGRCCSNNGFGIRVCSRPSPGHERQSNDGSAEMAAACSLSLFDGLNESVWLQPSQPAKSSKSAST